MEEKLYLLGNYVRERGSLKVSKWIEEPTSLDKALWERKVKISELINLAERELERAEKLKIKILFIKDEDYPVELRKIPYPPPFLYVKGELSNSKKLALVGSRRPTSYGKEVASLFAKELSLAGLCLVSGLARGIDSIVHKVCVKLRRENYAILGSGLDVIYPPENRELYEKILEVGGAILSEFPLGTKPKKENFPRRNRLISGISLGVLIFEAGERSGTLITAKWAQEQGKDVFAIPGNIFSEQSKGTHLLIKEGAIPITNPYEILEYLGLSPNEKKEDIILKEALNADELKIVKLLSTYPTPLEEILEGTGMPLSQLLSLLTELELKNIVISLPGKFYQLNPLYHSHLKP